MYELLFGLLIETLAMYCLQTFKSGAEASRELGINTATISMCCSGG